MEADTQFFGRQMIHNQYAEPVSVYDRDAGRWFDRVDENQPPKAYHVRPEYLHLWGSECTEETVIDERELRRLSGEWGISVDELAEQLEEIQ